MSPSVGPEAVARNILIVSTMLTGLMVLEYAWNIRFEVRVIWPRVRKSAEAKLFVIARYVGLPGQIFNVLAAGRMVTGIPNHPLVCKAWHWYQAATIQTLLMSVELLLMLQVCKLYNNDKFVLFTLFAFAIAQCTAMGISARMVIPDLGSSPICMVVESPPGQIYLGASNIAIHLCLLAMILWRYSRGNWSEPLCSYLKIAVRDSTCAVIAVTGSFVFVAIPAGVLQSQTSRNIIFPVVFFSLWFAAGRLVLDKEKFCQESQNDLRVTEMDLDDPGPDDFDVCPARSSDSKVMPTRASVAVDSELGVVLEEDITDEHLCDCVDDASLSSCAPTILRMEMGGGGENSEISRK